VLINYAVQLGADCAFFIKNTPMIATGIGEQLADIDLSLSGRFILLVYPNLHISTKEAYSRIIPQRGEISIRDILAKPISEWKGYLKNDFEKALFESHPILNKIKKQLYEHGAIYASMSGSGSCMFGIFDEDPGMTFPETYKTWSGKL